jgi:hypothetical protein
VPLPDSVRNGAPAILRTRSAASVRRCTPYDDLQTAVHNQRIDKAERGGGQPADNDKAAGLPQLHSALVALHDKIELHVPKAAHPGALY